MKLWPHSPLSVLLCASARQSDDLASLLCRQPSFRSFAFPCLCSLFSNLQSSAFASQTRTVFALPTLPAFASSDVDQLCLACLSLADTSRYSLASTPTHRHLPFSSFRPSSRVHAHSGTGPLLPPPSRTSSNLKNSGFIEITPVSSRKTLYTAVLTPVPSRRRFSDHCTATVMGYP